MRQSRRSLRFGAREIDGTSYSRAVDAVRRHCPPHVSVLTSDFFFDPRSWQIVPTQLGTPYKAECVLYQGRKGVAVKLVAWLSTAIGCMPRSEPVDITEYVLDGRLLEEFYPGGKLMCRTDRILVSGGDPVLTGRCDYRLTTDMASGSGWTTLSLQITGEVSGDWGFMNPKTGQKLTVR